MPPRCPECGRFLSNTFIQGLLAEPAACPRCGTELHAEQFHGTEALLTAPEPLAESVRPPDLDAATVRAADEDVLAGWDQEPSSQVVPFERLAEPWPPAPDPAREVALIVAAGVVGGLVAGLLGRRHRTLFAALGTVVGAAAAMFRRRPGES